MACGSSGSGTSNDKTGGTRQVAIPRTHTTARSRSAYEGSKCRWEGPVDHVGSFDAKARHAETPPAPSDAGYASEPPKIMLRPPATGRTRKHSHTAKAVPRARQDRTRARVRPPNRPNNHYQEPSTALTVIGPYRRRRFTPPAPTPAARAPSPDAACTPPTRRAPLAGRAPPKPSATPRQPTPRPQARPPRRAPARRSAPPR